MKEPSPILVSHLFAPLLEGLLALLSDLSAEEWKKPTVCEGWTVKDVALHLLGVEIGNLSRKRDGFSPSSPPIDSARELVALVNDLNAAWVQISRRISPRLLCDLLGFTGRQVCEYFQSLDPYQVGNPVSWAGPDPAPVWLDMAREYTERWHHQQHIRDALGRPGFKEPRFFAPVLDAFVRALPHTFRAVSASEGTIVTLTISGGSGDRWSLVRGERDWNLVLNVAQEPDGEISLDQDVAWRVFTRGIS
ncbi:MAG TPA: maleylpyruvate isomerase family mycothiol-dependent enzyme, partial [Anaerolineae bacterium]|nr:maleylpyruvate isomerase family mycothiol-dependent enzyme [Anaerolineae bacterium]